MALSTDLALQPELSYLPIPAPAHDQEGLWLRPAHVRAWPTISVVIPALNEAENLAHVLPLIPDDVDEILLVDGHSTDDTVAVALRLRPEVRIIEQEGRGKGAALRTGLAYASGDIIVMLDADGSTDPREIPAFVGALLAGADFAKGSRFMQGGGSADITAFRRAGNWGLTRLVRVLCGGSYTDLCYGYNAMWADVVGNLALKSNGFEIETEINVRALLAGLKIAEVPSFESPRVFGESRLQTIPDGWKVLKTIVRERFSRRDAVEAAPGRYQPPAGRRDQVWQMLASNNAQLALAEARAQ